MAIVTPLPPDIFWVAPDGSVIEGIGHLTMIRQSPELFDVPAPPRTRAEADAAFGSLLRDGWVRGRYSLTDKRIDAQIGEASRTPISNLYDFVLRYAEHVETVRVDATWPRLDFQDFTAEEFLAGKFPARWHMNPRRREK
jgi:hypothetical protein